MALSTAPAAARAQWAVTPLGFLSTGTKGTFFSQAMGVNGSGQTVGYSIDALGRQQAFLTGANGNGMTGLGFLSAGASGTFFYAGVNDSGQAVGSSLDALGHQQAFLTGANGTGMTGLGFLNTATTGTFQSAATGVNASGQVVGYSYDALDRFQALLTGADGNGMTGLGFLNTGTTGRFSSAAFGVNASGQAVGYSIDALGHAQAFLTGANGTGMTGLGFLNTGTTENNVVSFARGVNASGQVVGYSRDTLDRQQAFLTGANGTGMMGLGFLNSRTTGQFYSEGNGVNASGQTVGISFDELDLLQAFVTGANGTGMWSLSGILAVNGLKGWDISQATYITDNGYISAFGRNGSLGISEQALLIRVGEVPSTDEPFITPEPASLVLMASGLLALGVVARRRIA